MWTWFRGWCDRNDKPVVVITSLLLVLIAIFSFLNIPYLIVGIIAIFILGFIIGAFTHSMLTPQQPLSKPQPKAESVPAPSSTPTPAPATPAPTPISQQKPKPSLPRVYHGKYLFEGFEWPYEVELQKEKKKELKVGYIGAPICNNCQVEANVKIGVGLKKPIATYLVCPQEGLSGRTVCQKPYSRDGSLEELKNLVRRHIEGAIRRDEIDPYATARWTPKQLTPNIVRVKEMAKTEEKKVEPPPPKKRSQAGRAGKD